VHKNESLFKIFYKNLSFPWDNSHGRTAAAATTTTTLMLRTPRASSFRAQHFNSLHNTEQYNFKTTLLVLLSTRATATTETTRHFFTCRWQHLMALVDTQPLLYAFEIFMYVAATSGNPLLSFLISYNYKLICAVFLVRNINYCFCW
jgi:hypothetical protein